MMCGSAVEEGTGCSVHLLQIPGLPQIPEANQGLHPWPQQVIANTKTRIQMHQVPSQHLVEV